MKTALIYDWLVTIAGGEKTLDSIYDLFPSPIFALVHDKKLWQDRKIHTSFIQKLPMMLHFFRHCLPVFPRAIEQFDLRDYDLILSCSHAVAKGVLTHADQLHICYCYTPMRYAWDLYWDYVNLLSGIKRIVVKQALHRLRHWDVMSTPRVDHFIAISDFIARRIKKVYGREAKVIYPPVATHLIQPQDRKEDYYLVASRLVPYKRIDLIVEAFSAMPEKKLVVVGEGPEMQNIKAKAKRNIEILGHQEDAMLRELMGKAKGFVFAAEEDFGIVPVEAQAAGTPVIAFGRGGALETVIEGETGMFFHEHSVKSVVGAIRSFEQKSFDPTVIRKHAQQFSEERFKREFSQFVTEKWEAYCEGRHTCRW